MSFTNRENELSELIVRALDGCLNESEFSLFQAMLAEDPAAVEFYSKAVITNALLVDKSCIPISEKDVDPEAELRRAERSLDSDVDAENQDWSDSPLREIERLAKREFERFREQERRRQEELAYREYCARRRRTMVAAGSMAALVAIAFLAWLVPLISTHQSELAAPTAPMKPALVATLVKAKNAQWGSNTLSTAINTRLAEGEHYLKQGLVQILFDDGAEVLLQAPCKLHLESAGRMSLTSGAISADIPERAIGFEVDTPSGLITDYGTEFGVLATSDGKTETHVYQGMVTLESKVANDVANVPKQLRANQAATADPLGRVTETPFRAQRFIREISDQPGVGIPGKRLCVADMVAGGNGLGLGIYGAGVFPADGTIIGGRKGGNEQGGEGYIPVPDLDFIDGVFVPDGGGQAIVVSKTGLSFSEGPDTAGNCHGGIISQARFASSGSSFQSLHDGELLGRPYNTPQNPSVGMHANSGITIDLEKIRETMAGVEIVKFHSLCGVSSTVVLSIEASDVKDEIQGVDFWVLVDGKPRFNRTVAPLQPESVVIEVSLQSTDRFLTLMSTTPGPIMFCWGMLAEPYLELRSSFK